VFPGQSLQRPSGGFEKNLNAAPLANTNEVLTRGVLFRLTSGIQNFLSVPEEGVHGDLFGQRGKTLEPIRAHLLHNVAQGHGGHIGKRPESGP
jgi:hypothetical protein